MKTTIFAVVLGAVLVLSFASLATSAFAGPSVNYDADVHEQLQEAMEQGNFEAWRSIREQNGLPMHGRMMASISEENFGSFVEMHRANLAGDTQRAQELREELRGPRGMGGFGEHARMQLRDGSCGR